MELAFSIGVNALLALVMGALFAVLGKPDRARLTDAAEARALLQARLHAPCGPATLTDDGRAAVAPLADRAGLALLDRHARRWTARALTAQDLASVEERGDTLVLHLKDFGWPRVRLVLADAAVRAHWRTRLDALKSGALSATHA